MVLRRKRFLWTLVAVSCHSSCCVGWCYAWTFGPCRFGVVRTRCLLFFANRFNVLLSLASTLYHNRLLEIMIEYLLCPTSEHHLPLPGLLCLLPATPLQPKLKLLPVLHILTTMPSISSGRIFAALFIYRPIESGRVNIQRLGSVGDGTGTRGATE
ncbi:hypothetical protein IQ07DRAFT_105037 [Pyrenochaeta sp. DS3sAY3a]|nr:hypothetical protein IQ07DRAFT_105037 [Pyrenochaeta sp. DS3sAY3a]